MESDRDEIDELVSKASRNLPAAPDRLLQAIEYRLRIRRRRKLVGTCIAAGACACLLIVAIVFPFRKPNSIGNQKELVSKDVIQTEPQAEVSAPPKALVQFQNDVIVVPMESKERNVSIVWLYKALPVKEVKTTEVEN